MGNLTEQASDVAKAVVDGYDMTPDAKQHLMTLAKAYLQSLIKIKELEDDAEYQRGVEAEYRERY